MSLLAMLVKTRRCRVSCRISVSPSPMDATVAVSRGTGSDLPKLSSGSCRQPSNRCSPGRVDPGSFPCSSWLNPKLSPPIFGVAKKPNCRRHSRFRRSIVASGEALAQRMVTDHLQATRDLMQVAKSQQLTLHTRPMPNRRARRIGFIARVAPPSTRLTSNICCMNCRSLDLLC